MEKADEGKFMIYAEGLDLRDSQYSIRRDFTIEEVEEITSNPFNAPAHVMHIVDDRGGWLDGKRLKEKLKQR